jgi:hypothetical protein
MNPSIRETKIYAYRSTFKEINELINSKKEEDYYITDFDFGNGIYSIILEKSNEILDQFHWWSKTYDSDKISETWEKGYGITHLFYDETDWIYVFSKLKIQKPQAIELHSDFDILKEKINTRRAEGYSISKIAFGNDKWVALSLKDIGYNSDWTTIEKIDVETLKRMTSDGKIITDLVFSNFSDKKCFGENKWAIGYGKHIEYNYQIIESSPNFPSEIIEKRLKDGYDLSFFAYGDGCWFLAFSTKNKDVVLSNEKIRLSKEHEVISKEIEHAYNEKKYTEVIKLFENNIILKDNEDCVHQYLWSLWLNEGTEEKAYSLSCEYNSKFNTSRWNILKGHYSKWKKWYDNALFFYKNSSEKYYNEVLSIFEEFRKLYREKQFKEAIDYFQKNLSRSISKNYIDIAAKYLWALFKNSGTETTAYSEFCRFNKDFPNEPEILIIGGHITQWIGFTNEDIDKIEESIVIYKSLNKKEEIKKSKERLLILKNKLKEKGKRIKSEEKEKEREIKLEEKKKANKLKLEEKEKGNRLKLEAKEKLETQHKLKSSRGEVFCIYCGLSENNCRNNTYCKGKINGHTYVFMKDKRDRWHLQCNKCGSSRSHSSDYCQ